MKSQMPPQGSLWKSGRGHRKWVLLAVIVFLAGLALYRGWGFTQKRSGTQRASRTEVSVQVTPVVSKSLTYSIKVTGDILPLMQVDLFPKVSGYLERIDVHIGDRVKQGQVIARLLDCNLPTLEGSHHIRRRRPWVAEVNVPADA